MLRSKQVAGETLAPEVRTSPGHGRLVRWIPWLPVVMSGGYLAWLLASLRRVNDAIHLNPDATWGPVLARDLVSGPRGGLIYVGEASHLTSIAFLVLTRSLPFRDGLWAIVPMVLYLAGVGLVAWSCMRVAGRWPAILSLAIGTGAGAPVLLTALSEGIHAHTFLADAVLGASLVWLATRDRLDGKAMAVGGLCVVVAGSTLASDPLFLPGGLIPFATAPVLVWLLLRSGRSASLARRVLVMTGMSVVLALVITRWAYRLGFRKTYQTGGYALASPGQAVENLLTFGKHVLSIGNGSVLGKSFGVPYGLRAGMAVTAAAAVVASLIMFFRILGASRRRSSAAGTALMLHLSYWTLSGVAVGAAFTLSTFTSGPSDTSRYVIPVFFALAATVPLWAEKANWRRLAVSAGAAMFCLVSIVGRNALFAYEQVPVFKGMVVYGSRIISFLQEQGVDQGYAGYLNSHPLTYMSDMKVRFYPVISCRQPVSMNLCPFSVNTRTAWYRPKPATRTFVLFDAAAPAFITSAPMKEFGPPSVTRRFGDMAISIYQYDVASRFDKPCPAGSPMLTCPSRQDLQRMKELPR